MNDIVRKSLHFAVDPETMTIDLVILVSLLEVERVEAFRNLIFFTNSFLICNDWKGLLWTNTHHKELVFELF